MEELGPATEAEVILAFVKAEAQSPSYKEQFKLTGANFERLITKGDPKNERQNQERQNLLAYRGYPSSQLFQGWPGDVTWRKVKIDSRDLDCLYTLKLNAWTSHANGSSKITDIASRIDFENTMSGKTSSIKAIMELLPSNPSIMGMPIAAERSGGDLVFLEGNTRLVAWARLNGPMTVQIFVGRSPDMASWAYL